MYRITIQDFDKAYNEGRVGVFCGGESSRELDGMLTLEVEIDGHPVILVGEGHQFEIVDRWGQLCDAWDDFLKAVFEETSIGKWIARFANEIYLRADRNNH